MRIAHSTASFAAFIAAAAAGPALRLTVTGPSNTTDVENLSVKATLTNTGSETLKLINDPRTVLSTWGTNTFSIQNELGSPVFTGIKVKYSPELAAQRTDDAAFTVLAPGQTFELTHDLAGVYNFTNTGEGTYKFSADNVFQYVDASGNLHTITADAQSHTFSVAGRLASSKGHPVKRRRAQRRALTYNGCTAARQQIIVTADSSCYSYANGAYYYLDLGTRATPRYTTWFGAYDSERVFAAKNVLLNIWLNTADTQYDCTCTKTDTYAYVYVNTPGYIYLCGAFWDAPNTGTDSRAGTIVNVETRFKEIGGTDDYATGQSAAQSLASSNPALAILNADSYEYFAENNPPLE